MADLLIEIRRLNDLGNRSIAEPYAGGSGASLSLLFSEETSEIFINDSDVAIHDFWWSLVSEPERFLAHLSDVELTIDEWRRQREIYRRSGHVSKSERGFSAFYLNRCNRSGIIVNGGPIGGINQAGKWKLDARFNRLDLERRCRRVSEYASRINVSCYDGLEFLGRTDSETTMYFIDPPYFEKGAMLYLNALDEEHHRALSNHLRAMDDQAWILTYDDCPEIREMYESWANVRSYSLRYSARLRRLGTEVLVSPKWMRLPGSESSEGVRWQSDRCKTPRASTAA